MKRPQFFFIYFEIIEYSLILSKIFCSWINILDIFVSQQEMATLEEDLIHLLEDGGAWFVPPMDVTLS